MAADWSNIVPDLLHEILKLITSFETYVRFGAVCKSWRSAAPMENFILGGKKSSFDQVPWLMLAEEDISGEDEEKQNQNGAREFFSLSTGNIHRLYLPEASKKRCLSSQGWLLTVDEKEVNSNLLHPLSRVQIRLPRLDTFPDHATLVNDNMHFIHKFVLSSSPSSDDDDHDFLVMVIWGGWSQLGFCKPGDSSWTAVNRWVGAFFDITYHDGKLYGVDSQGSVIICNVHGPNSTTLHHVFSLPARFRRWRSIKLYLAELLGRFLIICRLWKVEDQGEWEDNSYEVVSNITTKFEVFEANLRDGACAQVTNLGDKALFLGHNSSFFVGPLADKTCKPNCIYFTDDNFECYLYRRGGAMDMGIYSLSDGTTECFFDRKSFSKVTPPTWVQPSFHVSNHFD